MSSEIPDFPLAVDLDGTLIETDLLVETAFDYFGREPQGFLNILVWLFKGRANLKHELARRSKLDVTALPYRGAIIEHIVQARNNGRKVFLASASDASLVEQIARHIGFDGWFASDGTHNLTGCNKLARLTAEFGEKSFDYLGNEKIDFAIWLGARRAIIASRSKAVPRLLKRSGIDHEILSLPSRSTSAWLQLLRPHQWAKNVLVFVPLLTSHLFTQAAFVLSIGAFVAFSLCASGVYIINDLIDIQADRKHPTKRERPFANGQVSVYGGMMLAPALIGLSFALGLAISTRFTTILASYLAITTSYSLVLKRKMLLDVVTLALLYTVRVIAGAAAIGVIVSQWLLAFSAFLFLSLALIKRYSEMALRIDLSLPDPHNRAYRATDLPILSALAGAAGFSAVVVFSLYLSGDAVTGLYRRPDILWLACPILVYWISRMLMLSHRREINDDPVVFALRDRISLITFALIALLGVAAI